MLFYSHPPDFWDNPGQFAHNKILRLLWRLSGAKFIKPRDQWIKNQLAREAWLAELAEQQAIWADQKREYEIMMAQYAEQGQHWADHLPEYLHRLGISYRRTVQDRKTSRPYERVDYIAFESWYFDEYAYYFWVATWALPYGVAVSDFEPGQDDGRVAGTLRAAAGAPVVIEFNHEQHERPGLWICIEHRLGRGKIPDLCWFSKLFDQMPKGAAPLSWPLGQGKNSAMFTANLSEVLHVLIGGETGGGKSNMINVILGSFIARNSPKDMRLFLVDFKRVELAWYKGLPHLGGDVSYIEKMGTGSEFDTELDEGDIPTEGDEIKVKIKTFDDKYQPPEGAKIRPPMGQKMVTEAGNTIRLLEYIMAEIQRRLAMLEGKAKKIEVWNKQHPKQKLSQWVLVIDELGDVMLQPGGVGKRIEKLLVRIIQLGRAVGVRTILATQTPTSQVITSLIKGNITGWVAFKTGTGVASGLMLNGKYDAARLPKIKGRAIFRSGGDLTEIQTPLMSDTVLRKLISDAKNNRMAENAPAKYKIDPAIVFEYALNELGGYCAYKELHAHFRKQKVSRAEIVAILTDFEAIGTPPAVEPEIPINGQEYYLAPHVEGTQTPRQLIIASKYSEWLDKHGLGQNEPDEAAHCPQPIMSNGRVNGKNGENSKNENFDNPILESEG